MTESACKEAAIADGKRYIDKMVTNKATFPKGCLSCPTNCEDGYYFNKHLTGGAVNGMLPVCKACSANAYSGK